MTGEAHFEKVVSYGQRFSAESHVVVSFFFSWEDGAVGHEDNRQRDCPACGHEMMPPKKGPLQANNPPAFSCYACGVTTLGDHSPKLDRR
jgi:hypothetical protein